MSEEIFHDPEEYRPKDMDPNDEWVVYSLEPGMHLQVGELKSLLEEMESDYPMHDVIKSIELRLEMKDGGIWETLEVILTQSD